MKPEWFWHLTLNVGDTRKSYRNEVSDDVIATMRNMDLLKPHVDLPIADGGYKLDTTLDQGGVALFNAAVKTRWPSCSCSHHSLINAISAFHCAKSASVFAPAPSSSASNVAFVSFLKMKISGTPRAFFASRAVTSSNSVPERHRPPPGRLCLTLNGLPNRFHKMQITKSKSEVSGMFSW